MRHTTLTRHAARALCVLAVFGATACSSDSPTEEEEVQQACTAASAVALTVAAGTTPSISWTPNCSVAGLFVQRVSDGANMWTLSTTTQPLRSAITYGVTPQFSTSSNPLPLVAQVQYRVGLVTSQGTSIATKLFTP